VKKAILLCALLVPMLALAEDAPAAPPAPGTPADATSSTTTPEVTGTAAADPKKAVNPLANAVQARTPEEQANQSGFQLISALDHYIGAGTFVDAKLYSSLSAFLTIIPQFLFGIGKQRLVASATIRGSYEYTLPDTETGRRWSIGDVRVGVSAPALFREKALTNIAFSPSVGLTLPTSLESWNAGMITSVSLGVTASRSVGTVDFRANVAGARAFFGQTTNGLRNPNVNGMGTDRRDTNGNLLAVCRQGELYCGLSNQNLAWSLSVGGQVQWRATGSFLLYAGYTYLHSWREGVTTDPEDPFNPKALDSRGNPVAGVGYGRADRSSAFVGGSYQLNEHYSLDLGINTIQTPLFIDKDGVQRVRFPFLSFGAWNDNSTSIYFTLSAAY
jgi:hypothetical protein